MFLWVPVPPKFLYRLRTGQRSDAATYCEPANSTKSQRIDLVSIRTRPISVIVNATPKTIDVIDLALFEFEVDGRSPEVVTANQRACEVRVRAKG